MLKCLGKQYFAISNLFVETCDNDKRTYPAPYGLILNLDKEDDKNNNITLWVDSYYESILMVDYYFTIFFYLLFFDGTIETCLIHSVFLKEEPQSESYGYKAVFGFSPDLFLKNITHHDHNFYDNLQKLKRQLEA